ncbi:unnamed protein product [Somion occarium]|uniref:Aminoglycoside phosphotransferase domain-containing protein n=1 Tax=Somion occarium TaxID=3059160 RepID=A0ABP1DJQ1_9APHY
MLQVSSQEDTTTLLRPTLLERFISRSKQFFGPGASEDNNLVLPEYTAVEIHDCVTDKIYVDESEIPKEEAITFETWTRPRPLPTSSEVRAQSMEKEHVLSKARGVTVVRFPSLNLVAKFGTQGTAEGQMLWFLRRKTTVPVPEVYGWYREGYETFIFMEYIDGVTLDDVWDDLQHATKESIAKQLVPILASLRQVRLHEAYVGGICHRLLLDQLFIMRSTNKGPLPSIESFNDYFMDVGDGLPGYPHAYVDFRNALPNRTDIVLTHSDLHPGNIMVTPDGSKVLAIIDWGNAGWYPAFWEYAKSRMMCQALVGWADFIAICLTPFEEVWEVLSFYESCGILI